MADNSGAGFGKDPLVTSHGDALADQSFQSLKSKEIRDSLSPTEMRFQSMTLNNPNTTGWNVQSAKEVSPDGRGFRAETVATTDGVESVNGGIAEFKGRNEQRSSAHHEGDDKNFVKKAMESSNSHLQEKVVIGDENSGRTEVRTSSTKSSSSSQVIQSSTNVEYENGFPIQQQPHPQKYLLDTNRLNQQDFQQRQQQEQQRLREEQRIYEQQFQQQHQQHSNQHEQHTTEQVSKTHQSTQQKNISQNIQTQETHEQNKRYVDMDKASPEYQQHVQHLMQQPGEIISNTVEYPKPNVKMITTVKRLPDGTIVRNKRYETEESAPTTPTTRSTSTPSNQTQPRRDSQQAPSRNYQPDLSSHSKPTHDMVDSSSTSRYVQDTHTDDMETKFSSIKKSSSKFSTETTSETIQDAHQHRPTSGPSSRPKPKTDDFSTHGFPSVRADKPTQEYPTDRPHTAYPSQSMPNKPNAAVVPRYTDDTDNITERRVNTKDGEVIIVSSEKKRKYKTSTNSERIVETEHIVHDDQTQQQLPSKTTQDFSTHGFPSVREPSSQQPRYHPSEKQIQPHEQDFPMNTVPPGTRINNIQQRTLHGEEEVVVVSSQKSHTAKHTTNVERIIEHDVIKDDQTINSPQYYTVTTPGDQNPTGGYPGSPKKPSNHGYSTQEYPSVRTPGNVIPDDRQPHYEQPAETIKRPSTDYATQGYPSVSTPSRPAAGLPSSHRQHPSSPRKSPSQDYSTQGFPSVRTPSKATPTQGYPSNVGGEPKPNGTAEQHYSSPNKKLPSRTPSPNKYKNTNTTARETTERVIRKEKEVDSAHRAFAASLRSSSPFDHTDYHSRHTPRSSVSSNRTFRRDMREGSHESAPSEASRISTTTITRNTPPRAVAGRTTVTKTVTTRTGPGSNDSLNAISPRSTKSPSPGKINSITTTTTTRTLTSKDAPKVTDNQHKRITSNKTDTLFPINEPQLTSSSITKINFSDNHKQPHKNTKYNNNKNSKNNIAAKADSINNAYAGLEEVVEPPCIKKHYYKLGPSDQTKAQNNTTSSNTPSLNNPQINEKSPTKKPSSLQPAPNSRSSTTSLNSRKPPTSVMTDDYDDDNMTKPSPFSSPSSRSRTPQKTVVVPPQAPQDDDWQMPHQRDNDELSRTVHRETTFEKPEHVSVQPHKPNFGEPNVEWVVVDDQDYDSDNDGFAPEVVDSKVNVKKITTKLITQEKHTPLVSQKKIKPITSTTTTKQLHTISSKTQTRPNDKNQLKTTPNDSNKTSPQTKTNKPLTESRKTPIKNINNKTVAKGQITALPATPLRKLKSSTTSKTSLVLNEKTAQLIETEKLKEHKTKAQPQTPEKRKPKDIEKEQRITITKTSNKHEIERKLERIESQPKQIVYPKPQATDDEPHESSPQDVCYEPQTLRTTSDFNISQEEDIFYTPQPDSPEFENSQNALNKPTPYTPGIQKPKYTVKPRQKSPGVRKPPSPGFQKLQMTFDERSPHFGTAYNSHDDDELYHDRTKDQEPQRLVEEHILIEENLKPSQEIPQINEPYYGQPHSRNPEESFIPQKVQQEDIFISKTYHQQMPGKVIPEKTPYGKNYENPKQPNEEPERFKQDYEPLGRDDEEYQIDHTKSVKTSQKTVAKHIQKFETNFLKNNKSKPQSEPRASIKEPLQGPKKLPQTPIKLLKKVHTTEESSDIEDDKQFENTTELVISSKQKYAITEKKIATKPVQETPEEPKTPGSRSPQRIISPTRNQKKPDEVFSRRPQSPDKHISPNRAQPGQKEPARKRAEETQVIDVKSVQRITSPNRNQNKPDETVSGRPLSPDKFSPIHDLPGQKPLKEPTRKLPQEPQNAGSRIGQRVTSPSRAQKNPEESFERRPQSPNKHVSPQRSQKIPNGDEIFTSSVKTTKVVKEKITQESNNECPLQPERKAPEKITKLPRRESSPTKRQDFPEKITHSVHKHISPTRSQNKQISGENKSLHSTERKPKGPKYYPQQTSDTEEDDIITETKEYTINVVQKQNLTEQEHLQFEGTPQRDSKYPLKATSPTRVQSKDLKKEPEGKPSARSPSPIKHTSPLRTQKTPQDNESFTTSFKATNIVKELKTREDSDEKYQQNKKSPKAEKGNRSPTREPLSQRPQSPNKPWSPTRHHQPVKEDEETFQTSLTITKTVTEKPKKQVPERQYPNQRKSNEDKPFENPSDEEEDDTLICKGERSKTYEVTEKEIHQPKSPLLDFSPSCEPELVSNETEFVQTTHKTTKTVTEKRASELHEDNEYPETYLSFQEVGKPDEPSDNENDKLLIETSGGTITSKTHIVRQNLVQEFDKPNDSEPKAYQSPLQPLGPEPIMLGNEEYIETNKKTTKHFVEKTTDDSTKKPIAKLLKPLEPLDTEVDKPYSKTMEFTIKTTHKKPQDIASKLQVIDDKDSFVHTSEFIRNSSQKLIETEQKSIETGNKVHPTGRSSSPKGQKPVNFSSEHHQTSTSFKTDKTNTKTITEDDKTFRMSLRKDRKPDNDKPLDTDEEESNSEADDLLIESCENSSVIKKGLISEENQIKLSPARTGKPEQPYTPVEAIKTTEKPTRPRDDPKAPLPFEASLEPWLPKAVDKNTTDLNEQFIKNESDRKETPDGGFISKTTEPTTPSSPTFRKKGAGRSDTFEERCRQILGMENYGDTQGTFKKQPITSTEVKQEKSIVAKDTQNSKENDSKSTAVFQVKVEDCDEDDEPLSINRVTTIYKQPVKEEPKNKPKEYYTTDEKTEFDQTINETKKMQTKFSKEEKDSTYSEKKNKPRPESPQERFKPNENFESSAEFQHTITETTNVHSKSANETSELTRKQKEQLTKLDSRRPNDDYNSEYEQIVIVTKTAQQPTPKEETEPVHKRPKDMNEPQKGHKNEMETSTLHKSFPKNKPVNETEPDSSEPETNETNFEKTTKSTAIKITKKSSPITTPRSSSPTKSSTSSPRSLSPTKTTSKETPKRKPSKDLLEPKPTKKSSEKFDEDTTTIKDRLRSSTRKSKSPAKPDQVDGSDSSPERSSSRYTERRRSSNISVTTEIIIEHTDPDSPHKKEKSPSIVRVPQDSVYKEIIDSTVMPEKLTRRMPVTERKESAPVHRVTNKEKDTKMSRSTSENLIKIKSSEPLHAVTTTKTSDHRRPNKCFATKSINLSATDRLINSGDMENVIIDIQHAKSSREPSPDKIVPTPVPAHLDTGKPRYPDVVQEPEDDQPKRKPQIKNIPIFEEENNTYLGCHITEINVERSQKTTYDSLDYEENLLENPVVEAPPSLDYISLDKPSDDESLLTVHEKVNKFQNITQRANQPKGENTETPLYSPIKLGPSAPQKSPELVRTISRRISRQNEPDCYNEINEDFPLTNQNNDNEECLVDKKKSTKEFNVSHHHHEKTTETTLKTAEKYQQPEKYVDDHYDDGDELIPHTATHTTIIEERRQKDILSRPSVFESRNKKQPTTAAATTTTATKTPLKCNKSPVKDSEKLRPDNKSRTKPTSAVTNITTEQTLATTTTATTMKTPTTTTTANATSNKPQPKQLPERKNSDIDYEFRGSNIQTGVKNIISKQTKVYTSNTTTSSDSKTNDLKKLTTTSSNKKPAKHMPVRLTPSQNTDEHDLSADDHDDDHSDNDEMIVTLAETTEDIIDIESQVVNEDLNNETASRKIPLHKIQPTLAHSSTNSSATDRPVKTEQKDHLVKLTDSKVLKSNTVTTSTTSIKTYESLEKADDIDETVLEPTTKKTPAQTHTKPSSKMATTTTDSVAARRTLFENNNGGSPKRTPLASPMSGRRPSYMEHTKSSLEHTRKDSLEINKTNYTRKPSQPDEEEVTGSERNSLVKFDVPHGGKRSTTPRATSVTEDINVEEIFDLEVLEKLMETVQSYEIRRRIRAQIRLIKKNQRNEAISNSITEVTTKTVKTSKVENEEPDTVTTTTTRKLRPDEKSFSQKAQVKEAASSSKKEYIFEEAYHPTIRRSPRPNRYPYEKEEKTAELKPTRNRNSESPKCTRSAEHERHYSPDKQKYTELVEEHKQSHTTEQHYYGIDEKYEHEEVHDIRKETSPSRKSISPIRKPHSSNSSPERRYASPECPRSMKNNKERSRSPQTKPLQSNREVSSRSPDNKSSMSTTRKSSSTSYEQQESIKSSTATKPATKRTTTSITKTKPEDKAPVWADRKNILKAPSATTPKKPSSSALDSRAGYTKTVKSTTSQKVTSNKSSSFVDDDDCVTSSYGIGPTDENGLPLFGIRALKKKKPTVEPSETTEEVTGYVVEEKYYSNNKSKPTLERKEFIYSTNPEELQKLKQQVEVTGKRGSLKDVNLKESREAALISKTTPALRSSPEDDFLDSTTKYVRRGSVKEMSEKFIQKEASSASVTEKTNNYPKAGLILRTSSRKSSRDIESENDNYESFTATRVQQHTSSALADSDDNQYEYEVEEAESRHSGRFITESESECDSIKTQREYKKVTSSSSSAMATRSFLNSQGEEKVITNVTDCLERMRNADNVVEEGDTAEDQEARALLNKFLGASIIMKGVESSLPAANRQSKIITTTTTTSSNLNDDNDGDNNAKHEVKTTRITKTIRSGSSSAPVTYTTCDIEEIRDEEILKELLEQARTYEERRKIRSRLRELMADREETKNSLKGDEKEGTTVVAAAAYLTTEEEESSASEYEEIIEEVTDYSEAESEVDDKQNEKVVVSEKAKNSETIVTKTEEKSSAQQEDRADQTEVTKTVTKTETVAEEIVVEENGDKTDSSGKGEFLKPLVHDKPQENVAHGNPPTNSKKLKLSQENLNNKSKAAVAENNSTSMYASYNNSNLKNQRATPTASAANKNSVVAAQTTGRADPSSISNRNNNKTNTLNSSVSNHNSSGSSSLGGNSLAVGSNGSPRQVDRLAVPQKEDSGTESGEDLRLIAAGLRDQLQIQNDSNIIEEVTCALSRLENSLKEGKDISVDTEKRKALLALVARLRAGLTSPEKLAEIAAAMSELNGNEGFYGETSSPEADAHRSNRSRFAKRKNRIDRHTVGVSREELADARRYMEDMLLMNNISQSTTPDANSMANNTPPEWYPLEKNVSSGAILTTPVVAPVLQRPKQFVPEDKTNASYTNRLSTNNGKRRPLSGEYSVSFENSEPDEPTASTAGGKQGSPEDSSKGSRFTNKKHLMKRANTIDLAKTRKYNPEFDTDSDAEDKSSNLGLKRAVQVSVKKRVQNVVPPFEPKTENDRKFLAFINKQSDKPGLGWTTSRSVSNWTNKFGSIKNTFEGGLVGKPPLAPHHIPSTTKPQQTSKLFSQAPTNNQTTNYISNQQIALRLQREAERQTEERRRKLEKEHLEYERRERDKQERYRQHRERQERERLEREHFERQRREQDQITAAQHAAILREREQLVTAQKANNNNKKMPQPIPINEFKHAPQSVFRPIENGETPTKPIYKPIPQLAPSTNNWQPVNAVSGKSHANISTPPGQYGNTRPDNSFITSPPPSSRSPIILPWASKPAVDSSSFKSKAHRFEERSKYDNINNTNPLIQRHNSLRSSNGNHIADDLRKRPSLPNTFDLYSIGQQISMPQNSLAYLPPPQNISFTYSSLKPKTTYQSYPCLPLAVANSLNGNHRPREDSLTNPHSVPLVLTSSNPSYCPSPQFEQQQQQSNQPFIHRKFDLVSPGNSAPASPSLYTGPQTDCTDDDFDSDNNLLEYHAVSRVMRKPQSQTAITVGRRTGHASDDELYGKNSRAAKNLLNTMKSLGSSNNPIRQNTAQTKRTEAVTSPRTCFSPDGRSYQAPVVEPLFPELNKFEANRSPVYSDNKTAGTTIKKPAQYNNMGVYKSMENLNRSAAKTQTNFARQQHEPNFKPYVSETQTSYVVTYPIDDLTDDEEYRRVGQKKIIPPNTLDINRHRHMSENSTGSSTTTSTTYSQNLPSPNITWTSNPIVQEVNSTYQNIPTAYQQSLPSSAAPSTYQHNYKERNVSPTMTHQRPLVGAANNGPVPKAQAPSSYEANTLKQVQQNQKQILKPADYAEQKAAKTVTSSSSTQKKSSDSMRNIEQPIINPKHSNISQEMLLRLDQQRERISNETKRKSLGNALDYQMERQSRLETIQNSQVYKSSAPSDTPDIVKSSLPKDDSQPILKKFGPPQRHHYMPNSYQSPNAKTTPSSIAATSTHTTKMQSKNMQTSTNHQTVIKKSQQTFSNTRPTVMETPATPQPDDDYIPRNIVYNNIHAFSSMTRRQEGESTNVDQHPAIRPSKLSKSDSWNQIVMLQSQHTPSTNTIRYNQSPTNELRRTKSGHTLAVPKMFEAAMTKTDITEKQKTVAAYFTGQKSPIQQDTVMEQQHQQASKRTVINRTKTSEKVSAASRKSLGSNMPIVPIGLQRSATMPHIANVNMLDESNVEDAFEQLIMEQKQQKSTSSTTEKTETKEEDGAVVTTTTKVTTRTVTGSAAATAAKPVTPFAKFKQLDKQNSQQSAKSPTTPTTTTGGGSTASNSSGNQPIFKFTDPALNAKAATVKEQLLQWCQSKTQEYENIEITNFSTSWNNGLAFCALIHHFLPDAFDYSQLTPKNRRKNFELAFTVADEKAGIAPLLDVEDMVVMQRPDWKCVFVYVQSIYRRFRNCQ